MSGDQAPIVFTPVELTCLRSVGYVQALGLRAATVRFQPRMFMALSIHHSTSPVEMAGTKAQAAAVMLGHHAPVSYGGNACLGATQHLREHRTAPAYECTALACVLQPLEGGQAAIPSMQPCFSCSGIRAAPPDGGTDGNTVSAAPFLAFAANARQCPLKVTRQRRCRQAQVSAINI